MGIGQSRSPGKSRPIRIARPVDGLSPADRLATHLVNKSILVVVLGTTRQLLGGAGVIATRANFHDPSGWRRRTRMANTVWDASLPFGSLPVTLISPHS